MPLADPSLSEARRDRYVLQRELGAGGMATMYLAEAVKHHRRVRPFRGAGGKVTVSQNGGSEPVWSRDGRVLSRTPLFDLDDYEPARRTRLRDGPHGVAGGIRVPPAMDRAASTPFWGIAVSG